MTPDRTRPEDDVTIGHMSDLAADRVPLSVLDLVPVSSGDGAKAALRNSIDLAQQAERLGYARFWLAEHHLNPGNAGSATLSFLGVVAAATTRIRIGTAATLLGHYAPIQIAEAAGLIATLFDGRMDLGLGRSGPPAAATAAASSSATAERAARPVATAPVESRTVDGLYLPAPVRVSPSRGRFGLLADLIERRPAVPFEEAVTTILAQLEGTFRGPDGDLVPVLPAEHSGASVWIHGSSAGESARLAGRLGLPFGANYHSTPGTVLDAVTEYREHFVPGRIASPHVVVSADVLVAPTDAEAEDLALGFAHWIHSVRTGQGTIPYLSPDAARAAPLDAAGEGLVADRVATRFVGSPARVVERLETLRRVTGADELVITTNTYAHEHRVRSYALLADAW
jgi:alkanesulfonate monooxygenase SsuD/methylene tetrahydromethanopterin reductase-like flavin-dependent oxidoreductase (luciferase family)